MPFEPIPGAKPTTSIEFKDINGVAVDWSTPGVDYWARTEEDWKKGKKIPMPGRVLHSQERFDEQGFPLDPAWMFAKEETFVRREDLEAKVDELKRQATTLLSQIDEVLALKADRPVGDNSPVLTANDFLSETTKVEDQLKGKQPRGDYATASDVATINAKYAEAKAFADEYRPKPGDNFAYKQELTAAENRLGEMIKKIPVGDFATKPELKAHEGTKHVTRIAELDDIVSTGISGNQVLAYDAPSGKFVPATAALGRTAVVKPIGGNVKRAGEIACFDDANGNRLTSLGLLPSELATADSARQALDAANSASGAANAAKARAQDGFNTSVNAKSLADGAYQLAQEAFNKANPQALLDRANGVSQYAAQLDQNATQLTNTAQNASSQLTVVSNQVNQAHQNSSQIATLRENLVWRLNQYGNDIANARNTFAQLGSSYSSGHYSNHCDGISAGSQHSWTTRPLSRGAYLLSLEYTSSTYTQALMVSGCSVIRICHANKRDGNGWHDLYYVFNKTDGDTCLPIAWTGADNQTWMRCQLMRIGATC